MNPFRGIVRMFQTEILLPSTINILSLHVNKKIQICIITDSFSENMRVDDGLSLLHFGTFLLAVKEVGA